MAVERQLIYCKTFVTHSKKIIRLISLFSPRRPAALAYVILCPLPCFALLIAASKVTSGLILPVTQRRLLLLCSTVMLHRGPSGAN